MAKTNDSMVRLFFAAAPESATRERIAAAAGAIRLEPSVRLVPRTNYHMTLAFIGEVAAAAMPVLRQIGGAQRAAAFALRFDAYEYWPKPEVIVGAARQIPPALHGLWQQLHRDLAAEHWALDPKRLRPHVTLANKVSQAPVFPAMQPIEWVVRDFCLMRSDSSSSGSAYTVVDTWPLLYEV